MLLLINSETKTALFKAVYKKIKNYKLVLIKEFKLVKG